MNRITLKAEVDDENHFTYKLITTDDEGVTVQQNQPFELNYTFEDEVSFECNKGPFTLTYLPFNRHTEDPVKPIVSPFGAQGGSPRLQLKSSLVAGTHRTPAEPVVDPHVAQPPCGVKPVDLQSPFNGIDYFTAYHYEFGLDDGNTDSQIDGMWIC